MSLPRLSDAFDGWFVIFCAGRPGHPHPRRDLHKLPTNWARRQLVLRQLTRSRVVGATGPLDPGTPAQKADRLEATGKAWATAELRCGDCGLRVVRRGEPLAAQIDHMITNGYTQVSLADLRAYGDH